jgi:hypothetical protein
MHCAMQNCRYAGNSCNNLKQIGLALHNYHDIYKCFPPLRVRDQRANQTWRSNNINWAARILPQMEQTPLYDQIDFAHWEETAYFGPHDGVRRVEVSAYRCPTDGGHGRIAWTDPSGNRVTGGAPNLNYGHINYVACIGDRATHPTRARDARGIFFALRRRGRDLNESVNIAAVRDGTSNTVAVAECVIGFPHLVTNASGWSWPDNNGCPTSGNPTGSSTRQRGNSWFRGYFPSSMSFNTLMSPNSRLFDCGNNSNNAMFAARSLHPGVVQCSMADGSTHAVSETIDWATWRWLGNKADGNPAQVP